MNAEYYDDISAQPIERPAVVRELSTYMTDADSEKVCRLFADGLKSGVGYAKIFDFMERQKIDTKMTNRLRVALLEYGDKLGEAFARFGILDAPSRKLILVSEEQGELPETFKTLARAYADRLKRKKRVLFGMIEPVIVFCLGVFVLTNLVSNIYEMALGDFWQSLKHVVVRSTLQSTIFAILMGGLAYVWMNLPTESSFREAAGRIYFRIPLVSKARRLSATASLAQFFRQSVRSGMDVFQSVELAAEASNSPWYMESVDKVHAALEAGYPLDMAFRQFKGLPEEFADYVGIGEETGRLDENLQFLYERYDELARDWFERSLEFTVVVMRILLIVTVIIFAIFQGLHDFAATSDLSNMIKSGVR